MGDLVGSGGILDDDELSYELAIAQSREDLDTKSLSEAIDLLISLLDDPPRNVDFTVEVSEYCEEMARKLVSSQARRVVAHPVGHSAQAADIVERKKQSPAELDSEDEDLYSRAVTVLSRSGVQMPPLEALLNDLDEGCAESKDDSGLVDREEPTKRAAVVNAVNALRSRDKKTRLDAAESLDEALESESARDALADGADRGALGALAATFKTASTRNEPKVQLAAAKAIIALIPVKTEPTELLQHAPALLAALGLLLRRRRKNPEKLTRGEMHSTAVAVAHFTVLLQQGWAGDEHDLKAAADDMSFSGDDGKVMEKMLEVAAGTSPRPPPRRKTATAAPARTWGRYGSGSGASRRRRAAGTSRPRSPLITGGDGDDEEDTSESDDDERNRAAHRSTMAQRTVDALISVACDAAFACNDTNDPPLTGASDRVSRALLAFAISNLAQLPASRPILVKRGVLDVLATWFKYRPICELHRHAASSLASICAASKELDQDEPPLSGAMATISAALPVADGHIRGWIDARVTMTQGSALEAMVPLAAAPSTAVREHVVASLAALVSRPQNRAAVVNNNGVRALIDALARAVRDLRQPPRAAAAASVAETTISALTVLAQEDFFCSEYDANRLRGFSTSLLSSSTQFGSTATRNVPLESDLAMMAPEQMTTVVAEDAFVGFLEEEVHRRRRVDADGPEEEKVTDLPDAVVASEVILGTEVGTVSPVVARPTESTSTSDGVRVGVLVVDNGAIPLLTAVICLADPGSSLRAVAVRALALLTDEERGCSADRWHLFFERAELVSYGRLADFDDEDTRPPSTAGSSDPGFATDFFSNKEMPSTLHRDRLEAPAAVDVLIRLCYSVIMHGDSIGNGNPIPLNDVEPADLLAYFQNSAATVGDGTRGDIVARENEYVSELTHVAFLLSNIASRSELAMQLCWRHGAIPVLVRMARSSSLPMRTYAMRALASLASPLLTVPSSFPTFEGEAIHIEDAKAAAAIIVEVVLKALDYATVIARGMRQGHDARRAHGVGAKSTLKSQKQEESQSAVNEKLLDGSNAAEGLVYEALRAVKALAFAEPLRTPLVGGALRCILGVAIDARGASPQLRALAEVSLVTLGFEGGARDLQLCGNDDKLLEEWFSIRRALELQNSLHEEYTRALSDAWPPPPGATTVSGSGDLSKSFLVDSTSSSSDQTEKGDFDKHADSFDERGDEEILQGRTRGSVSSSILGIAAPEQLSGSERTTSEPSISASHLAIGGQEHFWNDIRGTFSKVLSSNRLGRHGSLFRCSSVDPEDEPIGVDPSRRRQTRGVGTSMMHAKSTPSLFYCPPGGDLADLVPLYDDLEDGDHKVEGQVSPLGPYDASPAAHRLVDIVADFNRLGSRTSSLGSELSSGDTSNDQSAEELEGEVLSHSLQRPKTPPSAPALGEERQQHSMATRSKDRASPHTRRQSSHAASEEQCTEVESISFRGRAGTYVRSASAGRSQQLPRLLSLQRGELSQASDGKKMSQEKLQFDLLSREDPDALWASICTASERLPDWWAMNVGRVLDEQEAIAEDPTLRKQRLAAVSVRLSRRKSSLLAGRARRGSLSWHFVGTSSTEIKAGRVAANDGTVPPILRRYLHSHFPSHLQRRRVAPLHRVPGGSATWSPRATRVIALPSRQYFSFRREARVLARVIESHHAQYKKRRWSLLFKDARFAGEFTDSLATCLSRLPSIESLAFSRSKNPLVGTPEEVTLGECPEPGRAASGGGGGFFGGSLSDAAEDLASPSFAESLAYLVGALPPTVQSVIFDRMLGKDALQILGILLKTGEERRTRALRELLSLVDEYRHLDGDEIEYQQHRLASSTAAMIGGGPSLSFLAVKNHEHLRPEDFIPIVDYLRTCAISPPVPSPLCRSTVIRSLRWLDISGNRLGDPAVASVVSALDRKDSSITSLDVSANGLGAFATKTFEALFREAEGSTGDLNPDRSHSSDNPGTAPSTPKSFAGALFCGAKLRYLCLASNGIGPRAAARLLNAMVDNGAPTRCSLRGLSFENSSFGLPCAFGAIQSLTDALRALARSPGLLEELNLNHCYLQPDCVKGLLFGLVEARAAAADASPRFSASRESRPPAPEDDEFAAHESESDTEEGKIYPPMPSLAGRSGTSNLSSDLPKKKSSSSSANVDRTTAVSSASSASPAGLTPEIDLAGHGSAELSMEQKVGDPRASSPRREERSAFRGILEEVDEEDGDEKNDKIPPTDVLERQLERSRRRRDDPLAFLQEEEEEDDDDEKSRLVLDERGFLIPRIEDEDDDLNGDPKTSRCDLSRLSFVRVSEGNSVDKEDVRLVREELRRNRTRRVKRAAARRHFLRRNSSDRGTEAGGTSSHDGRSADEVPPSSERTSVVFAEAAVESLFSGQASNITTAVRRRAASIPLSQTNAIGNVEDQQTTRSNSDGTAVERPRVSGANGPIFEVETAPPREATVVSVENPVTNFEGQTGSRLERLEGAELSAGPSLSREGESLPTGGVAVEEGIPGSDAFGRRTVSWPPAGADGDVAIAQSGRPRGRGRRQLRHSKEEFSVCALFSSPLAWQDAKGTLHPIQRLDFDSERKAVASAFDAARKNVRGVRVRFDVATTERLRTFVTLRKCNIIHYGGHGHNQALTFEDGRGGLQPVSPKHLAKLVTAGATAGGCSVPELAFVSACHSKQTAFAFVEAGVPHVISVSLDTLLLDSVALAFTQAFYLSIAVGDTVKNAYSVGVEAVASSPAVNAATAATTGAGRSVEELADRSTLLAQKFLLLPEDADHDVPVLPRLADERRKQSGTVRPLPPPSWPPEYGDEDDLAERSEISRSTEAAERRRLFRRRYGAGLRSPPQAPDDFLGREVDTYRVVESLARKRRLISIVGSTGVGKSALVASVLRYAAERLFFSDGVIYLRLHGASTVEEVEAGIRDTLKNARENSRRKRRVRDDDDEDDVFDDEENEENADDEDDNESVASTNSSVSPLEVLRHAQCLLVLDSVELIDKNDLCLMLNQLFDEARSMCVLVTTRVPLYRGPALRLTPGSEVPETVVKIGPLDLNSSALLFASQCPQLHTSNDRRMFYNLMAEHPKDTTAKLLRDAVTRARAATALKSTKRSVLTPRSVSKVLSSRERRVLAALGNGFPADIVASAFETTRDGLQQLLDIADPTSEDRFADTQEADDAVASALDLDMATPDTLPVDTPTPDTLPVDTPTSGALSDETATSESKQ